MSNRLLIVSNFFYPEKTPRAFRTAELVKGFARKGYEVDLVIPKKEVYKEKSFDFPNVNIKYGSETGWEEIKSSQNPPRALKRPIIKKLKNIIREVYFYFFPKEVFRLYNNDITKSLVMLGKDYQAIISISQPLSVHLSVIVAMILNKKLRTSCSIAEFSDPMFKGNYWSVFPLNLLFGYIFAYVFNYFVVPIKKSKEKFSIFKRAEKIEVIPQGYNFDDYSLKKYQENEVITFAYAGRFYKKLRNPTYFLDELIKVNKPFHFIVYLPSSQTYFRSLLKEYSEKVEGIIYINNFIHREKLIKELSGCDFLINISNEDTAMVPSKLIDYAITRRPILSFNSRTFDRNKFCSFLNRDYSGSYKIDLKKYDIKEVIESYKKMFSETE